MSRKLPQSLVNQQVKENISEWEESALILTEAQRLGLIFKPGEFSPFIFEIGTGKIWYHYNQWREFNFNLTSGGGGGPESDPLSLHINNNLADLQSKQDALVNLGINPFYTDIIHGSWSGSLALGIASQNSILSSIQIEVLTALNTGDMTIGFDSDPDRFLLAGELNYLQNNTYMLDYSYKFLSNTIIKAYFTGSPTSGLIRITCLFN